jgi:NTP pyrophosphatase (non-canonical NTP hydrolase)
MTNRPAEFLAWAVKMFGPVAKLRSERMLRFVEEAIELAHAEGMERSTLDLVANRVYSCPPGNVGKEIGQAQACLETFAENIGLSSTDEAEREWRRVQEIPQEEWTRRQSAKRALGIASEYPAIGQTNHA